VLQIRRDVVLDWCGGREVKVLPNVEDEVTEVEEGMLLIDLSFPMGWRYVFLES
jgi:hypothetical protein